MTKKSQHVVPNATGGWSVKKGGSTKATKIFENKSEAVGFAKTIAKNNEAELYIHKKDGQISEKRSYGNDPCPPKDKK
jgi:hypothetical protein